MKYVQRLAIFLIMLVLSMTFVFAADNALASSTQSLEEFNLAKIINFRAQKGLIGL